ncbi:hypothetical protein LL037_03660 [Clostridium estertheticum]|uniref:hypothetical protein n=1 Tax=Clostridium estertheticum TaxID=238834 RepID=UPI001C0D8931|nr:hypothetical protein [Clostridium estertheticum]MBU3201567.1 hypothetical protein [Clostridium estertheticum]WAG66267.1 hypothetical protein LL037_03660 [Clostridium estertheticum]
MLENMNIGVQEIINYANGKRTVIDRVMMLSSVTITAMAIGTTQAGATASSAFTILGISLLPEIKKILGLINHKNEEKEAIEVYERCKFTQILLGRLAVKSAIDKNLNDKNWLFARWKISDIIDEQKKQEVKKLDEERESRYICSFCNDNSYSNEEYWDELLKAIVRVIDIKDEEVLEFIQSMKQQINYFYEVFKNEVFIKSETFMKYILNISNTNFNNIITNGLRENLNRGWFKERLQESIVTLGERYSEELDIPISEEKILKYLCFSPEVNKEIMLRVIKIEEFLKREVNETYKDMVYVNINSIKEFIGEGYKKEEKSQQEFVSKAFDNLSKICKREEKKYSYKENNNIFEEHLDIIKYKSDTNSKILFTRCINELKQLKEDILLMNYPYVLITGNAGIGKSHFIAHCAKTNFEDMGTSVLILGNLLVDNQPIITQIKQILNIDCNIDAFFSILNMYGRNSKRRSLIFFDGLNECNNRWKDDIMGFIKKVEAYPWISIIMSLRLGIDEKVEQQLLTNFKISKVKLKGFSNIKDAIFKFCVYYKVPINRGNNLSYILNTPLLLKLYFKSYKEQEAGQSISLRSIINNYIRNVNEKICAKKSYSSKSRLTKKMLNAFVDIILKTGKREVDFEEYETKLTEVLGINAIENNLINELIGQNILSYFCKKEDGEEITIIFFEYELLGDYLITERLLEIENVTEFDNEFQFERFFNSKNKYAKFISDFRIREILAVILPDLECKYKIGGFEIQNWPSDFQDKIDECMFFDYLLLRNPKKINLNLSYSFLINNSFIFYDYDRMYRLFDLILKLCTFEEHCYNITFFKKFHQEFTSAGFHREWTVFTSERLNNSNEFKDIIYLAKSQKNILNKNEKNLLGMTLAWCLVSLDEKVITTCEDALFGMYKDDISGLTNILKSFSSKKLSTVAIIVERLLLLSMHCMFSSNDFDGKKLLSIYIIDEFSCKDSLFQKYFMIHEYAKYIFDYAHELDIIANCNIKYFEVAVSNINDFHKLDNFDAEKLIKTKNSVSDDYYAYNAIQCNENEMYEFEDYYECYNNVIYSLMSLYTEVKVKYNHIYFKTEDFIDIILLEYREIFCKKVIRKIIDLGYNYIKFGFYDLYKNGEGKCIAQNYERMAFNIVLMEYISNVGEILCNIGARANKKITYGGLWALTYYETFDISSIANQFNQSCEDNIFNYKELLEMIDRNEFIRINASYMIKTTDIGTHSIIYPPYTSALVEGIYFSEIFVSKGFYKYFELSDENGSNDKMPVTSRYLWDCDPFSRFSIINTSIYKKMDLTISEDKMCYYYKDKLICKNTIKETGNDELLIESEFLKVFLSEEMYSIVWVFEVDKAALVSGNIIVQYDGENYKIRNIG